MTVARSGRQHQRKVGYPIFRDQDYDDIIANHWLGFDLFLFATAPAKRKFQKLKEAKLKEAARNPT